MRIGYRRGLTCLAALAAAAGLALATPVGAGAQAPAAAPASSAPDKGPVGWDVYRHLDRTDEIPTGVQTKQFSSFDRAGGNGDFNRCLSTGPGGSCVLATAAGAGEVDSIWSTRDGGDVSATGDITVVLDGKTVLHAPFQDVVDGKLGAPFVFPVVANADQSSGGVYIAAPMTYRRSMLIYTDKDPNYYHVTYREFADATGVHTFDPSDKAQDVIATLQAAGTADPKPASGAAITTERDFDLAPGRGRTLATVSGPGTVSALRVHLPQLVAPAKPEFTTDDGRAFGAGGSSQFTMKIDPANQGVRLIRKADNGIGHQRADIYVDGTKVASWGPNDVAGLCKWTDETVDLPASVTAGKSSITIKNVFVSSDLDFNEFAYTAESIVDGSPVKTDFLDVGPNHTADEGAHQYSIVGQTWAATQTYCSAGDDTTSQAVVNSNDVIQHVRIRVTADGQRTVDAPLGAFFGNGQTDSDARSLMASMGAGLSNWFSAWWPMPYASSLTVSLYNGSQQRLSGARSSVTATADASVADGLASGRLAPFHATTNAGDTVPGHDHNYVHTSGTGKFVGVTQSMTGPASRAYLEGDERVYVDGSHTPQIHGTGTEDYFEGGWYFNRDTFTDPLNGNPSHQAGSNGCPADSDCTATYRLMLADAVPFGSSLDFGIEHGPTDDVAANYSTTAFWYGTDRPTERWTDTVDVGNTSSEQAHNYTPAGAAATLTATYEGNNAAPQPVTDDLRTATARTSFTVAVDPTNHGVQLRRTADQNAAGQAVRVAVDGVNVGTWQEPLGNPAHRWLDDTFFLPAAATAGKAQLSLTLTPVSGAPGWTAARYVVQSLVAPFTDTQAPSAVSDLVAQGGEDNSVTLSWRPAGDDVGVDHYAVYASNSRPVRTDAAHLIGTTTVPGFADTGLGLHQTRYYRVIAVDGAGHRGASSGTVSATTGSTLRLEAERLLPPVEADAPADAQGSCCGVTWSGGAQLWFHATAAGQHVTLAFDVPTSGTYALTSVQTQAPDYGISTLAVDGHAVGDAVDGYHAGGVVTTTADDGQLTLDAGRHTLTLTVTGKNPAAAGYLAGLDYLDLRLVS